MLKCNCCGFDVPDTWKEPRFHEDIQDTSSPGWLRLLDLIEEARSDRWHTFRPSHHMSPELYSQIVTLPAQIAQLSEVRHLDLYGSQIVRIPAEIGQMHNLREFTPYTSRRLHWFPYEIRKCEGLTTSTVSTRNLYGNFKNRPPFPDLAQAVAVWGDPGQPRPDSIPCSICDSPTRLPDLDQFWISLRVATDVLPLLASVCSPQCAGVLHREAEPDYIPGPHRGGIEVQQPLSEYARLTAEE